MRLLNTSTYRLEEFADESKIPPYAILSHTWDEDEVTFDDIQNRTAFTEAKKSNTKIFNTCRLARAEDFEYAWIDTCCIDKSSSAELSEAINSMYRWYRRSSICYVHLADALERCRMLDDLRSPASFEGGDCRWFSRGWTLQELIAPSELRFYNRSWKSIGALSDDYSVIAEITGIDMVLLMDDATPQDFSIAKRFSWAAHRSTTRKEDEAYCLMGLFEVNMPLLYGEGSRAFIRLQEEIIKSSCDHSILAWHNPKEVYGRGLLFAPGVSCFSESSTVAEIPNAQATSFSLTNRGLHIPLRQIAPSGDRSETLALLNCRYEDDFCHQIALSLSDVGGTHILDYQDPKIGTRVHDYQEDRDERGSNWKSRLTLVSIDDNTTSHAASEWLPSSPQAQPPTLIIPRERSFPRSRIRAKNPRLWVTMDANCSPAGFYPDDRWNSRTRVFTPRPIDSLVPRPDVTAICLMALGAYIIVTIVYDSSLYNLSVHCREDWNHDSMADACSYLSCLKLSNRTSFRRDFMRAGLHFQVHRELLFGEEVLVLSIDIPASLETLDSNSIIGHPQECREDLSAPWPKSHYPVSELTGVPAEPDSGAYDMNVK